MTDKYKLTIDLNALNHLGLNLYSNIPAVISEAVANAWDADATEVTIDFDKEARTITIADNGFGMTETEINAKYLKVGYTKRILEPVTTPKGRHVMGRKGIGKLSLFSIADVIEVRTVKLDATGNVVDRNGFIMDAEDIKTQMSSTGAIDYNPEPIEPNSITLACGTSICVRKVKTETEFKVGALRKRLARRFSVIGPGSDFAVVVDGDPISVKDRDYFGKLQYLWYFGEDSLRYAKEAEHAKRVEKLSEVIDAERQLSIKGWIGTFDEQKSIDDANNTIVVLSLGRLVLEDLLPDIKEAGLFTKYLIGEIEADFLDADDQPDLTTSDRQRLKTGDSRYELVRSRIQEVVKETIKLRWTEWRNKDAIERALKNEAVAEWFAELTGDNREAAKTLFGRLEKFALPDEDLRRELYRQSIIAFETFAQRQNLTALDSVGLSDDLKGFLKVFSSMDQLEETHYYSIAKGRVEVLEKFQNIVESAKEKTIQRVIFDHLWLLHPSWERATTDKWMEEKVGKAWDKINAKLSPEERGSRLDMRYRTAAGKHIVIEMKKYTVKANVFELAKQIDRYIRAVREIAINNGEQSPLVEGICILGQAPDPDNPDVLASVSARYMTYDQLIKDTRESYREYLEANQKIGRVREIIDRI